MTTVLVVDDDADLRSIVRFALESSGFHVIEASHGVEAIESWRRHHPEVIILDVMMPEMDGLEVCRQLRRESDVPILFLSSRADEIDRIIGLELGGDDYITKPFSPRELTARVKAVHRRLKALREPPKPDQSVLESGRITHGYRLL